MTGRQLALELAFRPAHGREDFLISEANEAAVAWLDAWPDWPGNGLLLQGPPGSGKTHLAAVWRERSGAEPMDAAGLESETTPAGGHWVLDDADRLLPQSEARQRGLFHLYNSVREEGGSILVIGSLPLARWGLTLPDLRSRLAALPVAQIAPPDDVLLGALLVKLFADRQVAVGQDVVDYILRRVDRSFDGIRDAAARIDRYALARRRKVTVELARELWGRTSKIQDGSGR